MSIVCLGLPDHIFHSKCVYAYAEKLYGSPIWPRTIHLIQHVWPYSTCPGKGPFLFIHSSVLFSTGENGKRNRLKYVLCERESKRHYRLIFSQIVNNFCYKRIGSGISLSLLLLGNSLRLINSISKKQTVPPAPIGRSMK